MIVTVTLNPSVDRTISISQLERGTVNRADLIAVDPGGKGVNVSRALAAYGSETFALLVCGSIGSRWFNERLTELNVPHQMVLGNGATRNNITLVEGDGTVTKINEPGFELSDAVISDIKTALSELELTDSWVVFAGSLNPNADLLTYNKLAQYVRSLGAKVAIDTSGDELRAAIEVGPDLIKPNQHELSELVGRNLITIDDIVVAAREVLDRGVGSIVCSLGADGALYINNETVVHAEPANPVAGVPVGAGDILLATFIAGGANADALANAVAWSAASVPLEGTAIPTKAQAAEVEVNVNTSFDASRSLVEVV